MQRRRFLQTIAAGSALGLAGCGDGGGLGGGGTTTTTAPSGDEPNGDGGSDGGTPTETPSPEPTTEPPTPTETGTPPEPTETPTGDPTPTPGSPEQPTLGDTNVQFADNYRFRVDFSNYQEGSTNITMEGAWHGSNYVTHAEYEGEAVSVYLVGGTTYLSTGQYCTSVQGPGGTPLPDVDTEQYAGTDDTRAQFEEWADITAAGQATIDGEAMWVFQVDAGARGNEYSFSYYISQATGHLRRVESQGIVMEYWDWGNVPAIQAPC